MRKRQRAAAVQDADARLIRSSGAFWLRDSWNLFTAVGFLQSGIAGQKLSMLLARQLVAFPHTST